MSDAGMFLLELVDISFKMKSFTVGHLKCVMLDFFLFSMLGDAFWSYTSLLDALNCLVLIAFICLSSVFQGDSLELFQFGRFHRLGSFTAFKNTWFSPFGSRWVIDSNAMRFWVSF